VNLTIRHCVNQQIHSQSLPHGNAAHVIQFISRKPQRRALSGGKGVWWKGDATTMQTRFKEPVSPGRPTPSWLAIGMTVSTLATGAMMLGAGLAIGEAVTKPK
jgi:hypothetical protein